MLTCEACGHQFRQNWNPKKLDAHKKPQTEKGEERKTMIAAKANHQGPFCWLCRHLRMAEQFADARRLVNVMAYIRMAQAEVEKKK